MKQKEKKASTNILTQMRSGLKKQGTKTSILMRITRLSLLSMLVTAIILVIVTLSKSSEILVKYNMTAVKTYAELGASTISQTLARAKAEIEYQSTRAEVTDPSLSVEARKTLLYKDITSGKSMFDDISLVNADGKAYDNGADLSERSYVINAKKGLTTICDPVIKKVDGNPLSYLVGTPSRVEGFDGCFIAGIKISHFTDLIKQISEQLGTDGYAYILNSTGGVVAHPDEKVIRSSIESAEKAKTQSAENSGETKQTTKSAQNAEYTAFLTQMIQGNAYSTEYKNSKGEVFLAACHPIEGGNGWSLGVVMKKSEANKALINKASLVIIVFIVLIILDFIILLAVASGIANPVRISSNNLKMIAEGNLSAEFEPCAIKGDETGVLVKSLNETKNQLTTYINDISDTLGAITNGDLTVTVDKDYKGDFAAIKDSLNQILSSLNSTFADASEASGNLLNGAQQVERASQQLASAAASQAGAVVEITASIEDITRSTENNTADVLRANELTQTAKTEAASGNEQMQRMVVAMDEISAASESIAKITKVIDNIAFQTNILALNASVEAARAGVHGKGFSVVAEEVRNLAGKSSAASSEIAEMIENSIAKINVGSKIATETADDLGKIVSEIDEIATIMNNIATVSQSQAEAISQVNKGISQISNDVQNNSAVSEECAAASVELTNHAKLLMDQVDFYKLK